MPRIKMTRTAKIALTFLPIYILVMLSLILVRFLNVLGTD